jgi:hypothetical protein
MLSSKWKLGKKCGNKKTTPGFLPNVVVVS